VIKAEEPVDTHWAVTAMGVGRRQNLEEKDALQLRQYMDAKHAKNELIEVLRWQSCTNLRR